MIILYKISVFYKINNYSHLVQKPRGLTTSGRSDGINFIYLNSRFLTKVFDGHFIPANGGPGRLLQNTKGRFYCYYDYKKSLE